jgi:tripartite ATP-independent transporter DctP family solute receptor
MMQLFLGSRAISVLALVGTLAVATPAHSQQVIELRAGSSVPAADQMTMSLERFAEAVKQKTNGEVVVRVFPQSLGIEQQLVQAAQTGGVDIGMVTNGNASRFTDAYLVLDLPFLFKRYDDLLDFMKTPLGQKSIAVFEKSTGLKHLYMIGFGSGRDIQTTKKKLRTPDDIKGLKIRTISTPVELATFRAWGANPTPVDWGQTYTALQQGVVEGMQSNIAPVWAAKFYEVVKYNIRLNYTASFEQVFISARKFEQLSKKHQDAVLEAAQEAEAWIRKYSSDKLNEYLKDLEGHKMEIHYPTPEEYAQWTAVREKVWRDVAEQQKGKIDLELANQIYRSQQ